MCIHTCILHASAHSENVTTNFIDDKDRHRWWEYSNMRLKILVMEKSELVICMILPRWRNCWVCLCLTLHQCQPCWTLINLYTSLNCMRLSMLCHLFFTKTDCFTKTNCFIYVISPFLQKPTALFIILLFYLFHLWITIQPLHLQVKLAYIFLKKIHI